MKSSHYLPNGVTKKQALFFTVAILQVLFGISTLIFHKIVFQNILDSQLVVREGSKTFDSWVETPIPIYTKFYFFNMHNAESFQNNHDKPIVEEKGPYTFREVTQRVDLEWSEEGSFISYKRKKFWYFEPEMSVGPLTDSVITLNLPAVGAVDYARGDYLMEYGISDVLSTIPATLFINRTIGELLFDGYEDPLLNISSSLDEEEDDFYDDFAGMDRDIGGSPGEIKLPMDRFGWFYGRNGTTWADGELTMATGQDDINNLGKIVSWNKSNRTEAFPGKCGQVKGSADGLFAPGVLKIAESFDIWSTDVCRKLTFSKQEESQSEQGIVVNKFVMADNVFDNGTVCEENNCYENNLPTGVQNVTQCKVKSPAFLSRPHFHMADQFYRDQFQIGIEPKPERHESFFMIEPHTSIPVKVQMSLQLNVLIEKSDGVQYIFENLPRVFFPVIWFESEATLPPNFAGPLIALINLPQMLVVAAIVGIITGLVAIGWIYYCVYKQRRNLDNVMKN